MRRNQSGFSIIEMIGFIGFIGVVSYAVISLSNISKRANQGSLVSFSAEILRKKLIATIQDENAWKFTVADPSNTSLNCLKSPPIGSCSNGVGGTFTLRTASDSVFFNPTPIANGFTLDGENCDKFDKDIGSNKCPFRVNYTWAAVCPPTSPCTNPKVKISGKLIYMPLQHQAAGAKPVAFSELKNSFEFVRGGTVPGIGEGENEKLAKWVGPKDLGVSTVAVASGNLGIGTTQPRSTLAVAGATMIGAFTDSSPASESDSLEIGGRLGVGTSSPKAALDVNGTIKIKDVANCTAELVGTIRYKDNQYEGCFPSLTWCPLAGCPAM